MALPKLIFVTGKGGTGKSTVAAALAVASAREHLTTLAHLGAQRSAELVGEAAEGLRVMALSARQELQSFIERIVPIRAVARRMLDSRTFGYVSAALPGLEAFLMLERLRLLAAEAARNDYQVVVDGPATGSALELLSVASGVDGLAPRGTLHRLALELKDFLADRRRFGVAIVLNPERLALSEALEAAAALDKCLGIRPLAAILNCSADPLFTPAESKLAAALGDGHGAFAARRRELGLGAAHARRALARAGLRTIELPMLFTPALGPPQIARLARALGARRFDDAFA